MEIESIIFDLDGTLIDSIPAYFKIAEIILNKANLPPVSREVIAELMQGGSGAWDKLIPEHLMDRKDELIAKCMQAGIEAYSSVFREEVKLIPGVSQVFHKLSEKNIKIGLVTSSHATYLDGKMYPLKQDGLHALIDEIITIEDTSRIKPAPDPLIECMHRLGVSKQKSIYVGDSHLDIRAGKNAGMIAIGVLTGLDDREALEREDPYVIINSVNDLRNILF